MAHSNNFVPFDLDSGMHINQGFFRTNGGCGYVLKPAHLRRNRKF